LFEIQEDIVAIGDPALNRFYLDLVIRSHGLPRYASVGQLVKYDYLALEDNDYIDEGTSVIVFINLMTRFL